MDVKRYGYATSLYVRKTVCFLYYKGIDFTCVPVSPIDPHATIGHTNSSQVPVLEIDGEWRHESSEHGFWLDELFPEKMLCPHEHKTKVKKMDRWISDTFLTNTFRTFIDGDLTLQFRYRAWLPSSMLKYRYQMKYNSNGQSFCSMRPSLKIW